jgi:hypothetical protein
MNRNGVELKNLTEVGSFIASFFVEVLDQSGSEELGSLVACKENWQCYYLPEFLKRFPIAILLHVEFAQFDMMADNPGRESDSFLERTLRFIIFPLRETAEKNSS